MSLLVGKITQTSARKSQVADLREKHSAADAASVMSEVAVLKLEPSTQDLSDASSTSGNDVFTAYGRQLRLNTPPVISSDAKHSDQPRAL